MRRVFGISLCLLLLALAACGPATPAGESSSLPNEQSQPSSSSSREQSSETVSASEPEPEKTWQELEKEYLAEKFPQTFVSDLPIVTLAPVLGQETTIEVSHSTPRSAKTVAGFDGDRFQTEDNWYAYSADSLFFLASPYNLVPLYHDAEKALYYYEMGGEVLKLADAVTEISGIDQKGLYLLRAAGSGRNVTTLLHLNLKSGRTTPILEDVLSAYPVPGNPIIYYLRVTPHPLEESDEFNPDYRLSIRSHNRDTGKDTLLWEDDGIRVNSGYPLWYAFDGSFSRDDNGALHITLYYPFESEFPAWRMFTIDSVTGKFLAEENPFNVSSQEEIAQGDSEIGSEADRTGDPVHYLESLIERKELALDGYKVIVETIPEKSGRRENYYLSQNGKEIYLGTGLNYWSLAQKEYFFIGNGDKLWLYTGGEQLYEFEERWRLTYPHFYEGSFLLQREQDFYRLHKTGEQLRLQLLYEIVSLRPGIEENYYWKRPYYIGNFILEDTPDNGCFILCHVPSGTVQAINGDGMVLRVARKP